MVETLNDMIRNLMIEKALSIETVSERVKWPDKFVLELLIGAREIGSVDELRRFEEALNLPKDYFFSRLLEDAVRQQPLLRLAGKQGGL